MLIQTAIQIKAASCNERAAFYAMLYAVAKPEEVDKALLSWRRSCGALDYLLDLASEEEVNIVAVLALAVRLRWWTLAEALDYLHQQNSKGTHERC